MKFIINKHSSIKNLQKSLKVLDISELSNLNNIQIEDFVTKLSENNLSLKVLDISSLSNLDNNQTGDFLNQEHPRILVRSNNSWKDITNNII